MPHAITEGRRGGDGTEPVRVRPNVDRQAAHVGSQLLEVVEALTIDWQRVTDMNSSLVV
jgi:hypothetical protein